jgi:hypothetical protein
MVLDNHITSIYFCPFHPIGPLLISAVNNWLPDLRLGYAASVSGTAPVGYFVSTSLSSQRSHSWSRNSPQFMEQKVLYCFHRGSSAEQLRCKLKYGATPHFSDEKMRETFLTTLNTSFSSEGVK